MTFHGKVVRNESGKIVVKFGEAEYPVTSKNGRRYIGRSVTMQKDSAVWIVDGTKAAISTLSDEDACRHDNYRECTDCMEEVLSECGVLPIRRGLNAEWSVLAFPLKVTSGSEYHGDVYLLDEERGSSATWAIVQRWSAPCDGEGGCGHVDCTRDECFNDKIEYVKFFDGDEVRGYTPTEIRDVVLWLKKEGKI